MLKQPFTVVVHRTDLYHFLQHYQAQVGSSLAFVFAFAFAYRSYTHVSTPRGTQLVHLEYSAINPASMTPHSGLPPRSQVSLT